MSQALQIIGHLVSPPWTTATVVAGAVVRVLRAVTERIVRPRPSAMPPMSDAWLHDHDRRSHKRGEDL